jgi:2-methylisocitrate lyase-like PEP mutase family enzyme
MTGVARAASALRAKLDVHRPALAMAAHNPLAAKLAAAAGFDAIWGSGFELSASYAVPDANILSMNTHLEMMRAIGEVQDRPVIADIDTGFGNAVNVAYAVPRYVAAGVAAIVMEDKIFPKDRSLRAGGRHELLPVDEFQGKIEVAKAVASGALVVAAHGGVDRRARPGGGASSWQRLCRGGCGRRSDPQQAEDAGRNPIVLPGLVRACSAGLGTHQLSEALVRGCRDPW